MRCNGLPNAYDSGDLRQYIHMWSLENDKHNRNERNWLLHTNERTILTQDRRIENATRINLQQQQMSAGDLYAKRAKEVLGVSAVNICRRKIFLKKGFLSDFRGN